MFKFNNDHIFTGYLKQLLSSFHLPKCKVYSSEQQNKFNRLHSSLMKQKRELNQNIIEIDEALEDTEISIDYKQFLTNTKNQLKNDLSALELEIVTKLDLLQSTYHSSYDIYPGSLADLPLKPNYPSSMRYIPYIKDGILQLYTEDEWKPFHQVFDNLEHIKVHKNKAVALTPIQYSYGQKILNYTKNLKIQNNIYDSYTHEYLGDYLRFHRDFANINLMPLYNCFSNRACQHLDLTFDIGNDYKAVFKTDHTFETTLYKYFMVPVKFFKEYTIAIDSSASVEVCCCIYDQYYNQDKDV